MNGSWRLRSSGVLLTVLLVLGVNLGTKDVAWACGAGLGSHPPKWYAVTGWDNAPANLGARAGMNVAAATENTAGNHWIAQVLWEATNNNLTTTVTPGHPISWVEAGWTKGFTGINAYFWYWAQNIPGQVYYEQDLGLPIASGDSGKVQIQFVGFNNWDITVVTNTGMSATGHAYSSPPVSYGLGTGLENDAHNNPTTATMSTAKSTGLSYLQLGGWQNGWTGASTAGSCDSPFTGSWSPFPDTWTDKR